MSIAGEKVHPAGLPTGWASTDCVPPTPRSTDTELPHADVICDVQRALNSANTVRMPKITGDHYNAQAALETRAACYRLSSSRNYFDSLLASACCACGFAA